MDPYTVIAPYYDLEHADFLEDIPFYLSTIRDGPILEVGVGTGRILTALGGTGLELYGVDSSAEMLALAGGRLANCQDVTLFHARLREVDVPKPIATAILSLNFLWHLNDDRERAASLSHLRTLMKDSGLLLIDLTNPWTMSDRGAKGEVRQRFHIWDGDSQVTCTASTYDDEVDQLLSMTLTYDKTSPQGEVRRATTELDLRYLYSRELELLLRTCSFELCDLYGSYDLGPYSAYAPGMIATARVG